MHDLNYFRDHLEVFAEMAKKRGAALDLDAFRKLDKERRELITATEQLKAQRNKANEEIARLKKEKKNADSIIAEMKQVSERIKQSDERIAELDATQRELLLAIPNIPHSSVPVGTSAADNKEVRRWGAPPKFDFAPKPHWEVGERAGILDLAVATKITGARFAVYKGWGARLERALASFFLDVHTREHGYTEILPPFLVNTASLTGAGQLPKFAADLFKVENTDFWLTPTSEVELHNLYRDETIPEEKLPIHLTAWSACFRSEAGAAGKDTRGILRQHQFQKVELFKFTHPEKSYEEHEALVRNAETILQKLGLHYRTVLLCTGDMGFASRGLAPIHGHRAHCSTIIEGFFPKPQFRPGEPKVVCKSFIICVLQRLSLFSGLPYPIPFALQPLEITPFRLTRPFRLAYTRDKAI